MFCGSSRFWASGPCATLFGSDLGQVSIQFWRVWVCVGFFSFLKPIPFDCAANYMLESGAGFGIENTGF